MPDFMEISNSHGLSAYLLPYSATLARLTFLAKNGEKTDLVLGFDTAKDFEKDTVSMGKTVGRVANRIQHAKLSFDGKQYDLEKNNGSHFLHGGSRGPCHRDWEVVRRSDTTVSFRVKVDESEDGLPGNAIIETTYTVNDRNQLIVEHYATCDRPGVLALTNHAYWNLDGSENVLDHFVHVEANEFLQNDKTACPTGEVSPVEHTKYDFRNAKKLRHIVDERGILTIDNDLVLNRASSTANPHPTFRMWSEKSKISMSITTSYPVIHLYGGEFLDTTGRNKEHYGPNKGLAIEAQFHSAAANFPHLADVSLRKGQQYEQEIVYSFTHI